jgi:carboxyl-terminal processing protease
MRVFPFFSALLCISAFVTKTSRSIRHNSIRVAARPQDGAFGAAAAVAALAIGLGPPVAHAAPGGDPYPLFHEVYNIVDENFFDGTYNGNDWARVKVDYEGKLSSGADEHKLTEKLLSKLGDKYTRILDKATYESLWKYDAIGVGILFESNDAGEMIVASAPISGSSGAGAKLGKGDRIRSVSGKSTKGMTAIQLLDMVSNDDSDVLELSVIRADSDPASEPEVMKLARSKQKAVNPVSFRAVTTDSGRRVGYIKLSDFNSEAVSGIKNAVTSLDPDVNEYVLDLRGNTGGGFQFALNIGGMFMQDRPMVTARGNDRVVGEDAKAVTSNVQQFRSSYASGPLTTKPLSVWLDGLSASASEVLAGALHDNCRAITTGSTSFGKGKIQAVFGLTNGEGMTMTVAQYVTPKGTVIQAHGLIPDVPTNGDKNAYLNMLKASVTSLGDDVSRLDLEAMDRSRSLCVASL